MIPSNTIERASRKEHICDYCRMSIPAGQHHRQWLNILDDGLCIVRAHIACDDVAETVWRKADTPEDEREVCDVPLMWWAEDHPDLRASLEALADKRTWPDGEVDRLTRWMEKDR